MPETKLNRFIYDKSPVFIQNLMTTTYGWEKYLQRYMSPTMRRWLEFYQELSQWPQEKLREYQIEELKKTIKNAYENVQFYRKRFDENGLKPSDIKNISDLAKLPYLTKDEVRKHSKEIISKKFKEKNLFAHPTSGSTGTPMMLYNSKEANYRNSAYWWTHCRSGLSLRDKQANFTGLEIVAPNQNKPPFWRMNYARNQRLYSIFHMSEQNLRYYVEDLQKFKPVWIYGYPSAIYVLAKFMLDNHLRFSKPPMFVHTSSEQCLPEYRKTIEVAFDTLLRDEYGQGEMAGLVFQCECGKLHEKIDYSLIEFVPTGEQAEGVPVNEMICTSFINEAWPLIRYQVGDLALIDPHASCSYGHPGRIIEQIYGRTASYLLTKDGSRISNISVMAKKCRNIKQLQAVQNERGKVILRVVPDDEFDKTVDEQLIIKEFRKKLGDESRISIGIEYVKEIQRTKAGKFISIINNIKQN